MRYAVKILFAAAIVIRCEAGLAQDATNLAASRQQSFAADENASGAVVLTPTETGGLSDPRSAPARAVWGDAIDLTACLTPLAVPTSELVAEIERQATAIDADAKLARLIAHAESATGQSMISPAGALGLMQLMPGTAKRYGVSNPCDWRESVRGGVSYLKDLTTEFQNPMLVIAAYNAGEDAVYRARGVPTNAETVRYVAAIANDYYGFSNTVHRGSRARSASSLVSTNQAETRAPTSTEQATPTWTGGQVMYVK